MVNNPAKKFQKKNLAQQACKIKIDFPEGKFKIQQGNFLIWEGWVTPTPDSCKYCLCINYRLGGNPYIWVVEPPFYKEKEKIFPHVFLGNRLCLYLPSEWRWSSSEWISETIIPWACLWLYYYEIHKITGEWKGGGKHPEEDADEDSLTSQKSKKLNKKKKTKKLKNIKCIRLNEL